MALDLSKTATSLLKSLGANTFKVINKTSPSIDPDTGLPTGSSVETSEPFYGAMVSYSNAFNDNTNIQSGDKQLIAEPSANIKLGSIIEDYAGERWSIVNPNEVNTVGVTQVYELQIRKQ